MTNKYDDIDPILLEIARHFTGTYWYQPELIQPTVVAINILIDAGIGIIYDGGYFAPGDIPIYLVISLQNDLDESVYDGIPIGNLMDYITRMEPDYVTFEEVNCDSPSSNL